MSSNTPSSGHEKRHRSLRVVPKSSSGSTNPSSIIATPPRAALQGRGQQHSAADEDPSNNASSSTSSSSKTTTTPETTDSSPHTEKSSPNTTNTTSTTRSRESKRIAELEHDLASITHAFSQELATLSQTLTNERDSSAFWQQKHSLLNQTFLKNDTDLRLLKQELSTLQFQENTRVANLVVDRDSLRDAYNEAMGEVRGKEEEVRKLQGQVRGLKSWVSSSSKVDEQVADEAVGERMQRLGNGLQNWVITNFRRVRIDTEKANDDTLDLLMQLVPTYSALAATSKIHLIQSLVSRIMVEHIFLAYFVGLPQERSEELENVEKHLSNFGTIDSMNQWRSATLAILRKDASQTLASSTSKIVESLVHQINSIMTSISDIQPSEARDASLRALINSSIDLSRLLRVQKAVFSILMPCIEAHQQTMFDADCMEDIGGEDEDTLSQREIRCVTFPGIVKSGDENGERNHLRNVVAKIRVLCAPD